MKIEVRINGELKNSFKAYCDRESKQMSEVLREYITSLCQDNEKGSSSIVRTDDEQPTVTTPSPKEKKEQKVTAIEKKKGQAHKQVKRLSMNEILMNKRRRK